MAAGVTAVLPGTPCVQMFSILHSLHNSVKYGLGLADEKEKRQELIADDTLGDMDGLFVQAHDDGEDA